MKTYRDAFNEILSNILFEIDPVGTFCKENDSFDEYDYTSKLILDKVFSEIPQDFSESLEEVVTSWHGLKNLHPLLNTQIANEFLKQQKELLFKDI